MTEHGIKAVEGRTKDVSFKLVKVMSTAVPKG